MSENEIIKITEKNFEDIKHTDENGVEYWYARELMVSLGYKDWRYFDAVIEKAKIACKNSEMLDIDHFVVDNKIVEAGISTKTKKDYKLTRYVKTALFIFSLWFLYFLVKCYFKPFSKILFLLVLFCFSSFFTTFL